MHLESIFTEQVVNTITAKSKCEYLKLCNIYFEQRKSELCLVIDCPGDVIDKVWEYKHKILSAAFLLGFNKKLILKREGSIYASASSRFSIEEVKEGLMHLSAETITKGLVFNDLLLFVANSQYPTFVTEVPRNWHWGQPQRLVLTNSQVTNFSGVKSTKLHGEDMTLLYDRVIFERQMSILTREFEKSPKENIVKDYAYTSYTIDKFRQSLCRDSEHEYNADFKMIYIEDLDMIARVCCCKDRRPVNS
ncbi:hypothetical protein [Anabaena lutea]|uniref:Uncharacterized protein n=1 Tax=Anabaena lutea FACHB-196 TaxID=2692881 RepID=A0ABR8FIG1_9NOST|nr:hypothetical protein [Anabaena lutea]MBD2570020.1 hypothetical protein [Anabaena lutea FACHB-196]